MVWSGVEFDLEAFEDDLRGTLRASRAAFEGRYKAPTKRLVGTFSQEIDEIIPGTRILRPTMPLSLWVKGASANNVDQATLLEHIDALGANAKTIASRILSKLG